MNNQIEASRNLYSELDFLTRNSVNLLLKKTKKDSIFIDYQVLKNLNQYQHKSKLLLQNFENEDEKSKALNEITCTSSDLPEFYSALQKLKNSYASPGSMHE